MAVERAPFAINFTVNGATIPARFIVKNASTATVPGAVALWDTATAYMVGLSLTQSGGTGTAVQVAIAGTAKAQCGASVSAGALLTGLTATGEVVEATIVAQNTTTATVPFVIGYAQESGASGAAIEVLINNSPIRLTSA